MKRTTTLMAAALSMTLVAGALVGCGGQQSSTSDSTSAATSATTAAQTQEELVAELKKVSADSPEFKSVTVIETDVSTPVGNSESSSESTDEASSEESTTSDVISGTGIYKFDASGEQLRTSAEVEALGIKETYYTDGENAVRVTDGPIYGGTAEQFSLIQAKGLRDFITSKIGNLDTLTSCLGSIEKTQQDGITTYTLTLDPQKYTDSDEILRLMADTGNPLQEAVVTFNLDQNGNIVSMSSKMSYATVVSETTLSFSDFDNTTVDPMPEATSTYEQMEADIQAKLEEAFSDNSSSDEITEAN